MQMKHEWLIQSLQNIASNNPEIDVIQIGESVEGRSINKIHFGRGSTKVLLWSQMHGDEPTATAALLAVFNYFANNLNDVAVQELYHKITIHAILMLNPDGAQRYQRRNAQDIDINRDARLLQSPEGRALKSMQEQIQPHYGFNLHDMGGREMVADSKKLLSLAFMAPPFDKENSDNATRIRAKKLVVIMKNALTPFLEGHMARYKADYMPRAFGDAMQNWGVSTVLLESGLHQENDPRFLVRLNFVALLAAFQAIANDEVKNADAALYDQMPLEGIQLFDILIKNALVYNGNAIPPFKADIGINMTRKQLHDEIIETGQIADIGDLSITDGLQVIEAEHLIAVPGLIARITNPLAVENLLAAGVITAVVDENYDGNLKDYLYTATRESSAKILPMPAGAILSVNDIPDYTSRAAASLGLENLGIIKRNRQADIVIFNVPNDQKLHFDQLRCVLKNGKIVFEQ
jgi:hypothetical protein